MTRFFRSHPIPVTAHFETSLILTYAVPVQEIQHLIPPCCVADTLRNEWGFVAVAMVQVRDLRPRGLPRPLGSDFILIGYRVFVRYTSSTGRQHRGLVILRSETDSMRMRILGDLLTTYKYSKTDVRLDSEGGRVVVSSERSHLHVVTEALGREDPALPVGSPFADWKEARRFQGPMPYTFSFDPRSKVVTIVRGVREQWRPVPVRVVECSIGFVNDLHVSGAQLASATVLRDVPYRWERGIRERWNQ